MEDTLQQEKQALEYKDPSEDQGGIRRRLRDRDLLRKRKAEAEENETNQWVFGAESQRKRRTGDRSSAKKRGRPRKTEPTPQISDIWEEALAPQTAPAAVVVVSEPAEIIPYQTGSLSSLPTVESKQSSAVVAPPPLFGSVQSSIFAPTLTPPASADPAQNLFSPSVLVTAPTKDLDTAPILVQDLAPASDPDVTSVPALTEVPVPAAPPATAPAPPTAPSQVGALYIESQERDNLNQVTIEDLGPDEQEDISLSQDNRADEDLSGPQPINIPEQSKMLSVPTLSSPPPPQEYLPGN